MCAGMDMSITQLAGQSAAIDLLGRTGALDASRFESLNRQLQPKHAKSPTAEDIPPADQAQMKKWRALVAQWFAWYQCTFLFGAAAGGLVLGWLGDRIAGHAAWQ